LQLHARQLNGVNPRANPQRSISDRHMIEFFTDGRNSRIVSTTRRYDICAASFACSANNSGVARSGTIDRN